MPNVFVEPMPKGDSPSTPSRYQIECAGGSDAVGPLPTYKAAVIEAKKRGYKPLVARVRNTSKGTLATGAPQTNPRLAKVGSGWRSKDGSHGRKSSGYESRASPPSDG